MAALFPRLLRVHFYPLVSKPSFNFPTQVNVSEEEQSIGKEPMGKELELVCWDHFLETVLDAHFYPRVSNPSVRFPTYLNA